MNSTILVDIIKGFFSKTPKRLKIFRNICLVLAFIITLLLLGKDNNLYHLPKWLDSLIGSNGIIYLIIAAGGVQMAKKDINEK